MGARRMYECAASFGSGRHSGRSSDARLAEHRKSRRVNTIDPQAVTQIRSAIKKTLIVVTGSGIIEDRLTIKDRGDL